SKESLVKSAHCDLKKSADSITQQINTRSNNMFGIGLYHCRNHSRCSTRINLLGLAAFLLSIAFDGDAVSAQLGDPTGRSAEQPQIQKLEPEKVPKPELILPPVPQIPEGQRGAVPSTLVFVRKINVVGSTVFSPEELNQFTAPYENRQLSYEDLEALRV